MKQQQQRHAQRLAEMESKRKLEQATHKKALHFYYWESGPVAMVTTSDLKCVCVDVEKMPIVEEHWRLTAFSMAERKLRPNLRT